MLVASSTSARHGSRSNADARPVQRRCRRQSADASSPSSPRFTRAPTCPLKALSLTPRQQQMDDHKRARPGSWGPSPSRPRSPPHASQRSRSTGRALIPPACGGQPAPTQAARRHIDPAARRAYSMLEVFDAEVKTNFRDRPQRCARPASTTAPTRTTRRLWWPGHAHQSAPRSRRRRHSMQPRSGSRWSHTKARPLPRVATGPLAGRSGT